MACIVEILSPGVAVPDASPPPKSSLTDEQRAQLAKWKTDGIFGRVGNLVDPKFKLGSEQHLDKLSDTIKALRAVIRKYQTGEQPTDDELAAVKCRPVEATA